MTEIQFQEPPRVASVAPRASAISRVVLASGIAKTEREAQVILLVLAVIALGAMAFIFITSTPSTGPSQADIEEALRG